MITRLHLRDWHGISGTFDLAPRTLLTGPNGSGKTSIMEAIAVALTGYTALGKKPGATLAHSSGKTCSVGVESEDGHILSRTFKATDKGGTMTTTLDGDTVKDADLAERLPASLRFHPAAVHPAEFLALSGDKRAAFLFGALGPDATGTIDPEQVGMAFAWLKAPLPADQILTLLAGEEKSARAEIERCVATIQRLTGQEQAGLPAGTLSDWQAKLKAAEAQLEALVQRQAKAGERTQLAGQRALHRSKLAGVIDDCERKIQACAESMERDQVELDRCKAAAISANCGRAREVAATLDELRERGATLKAKAAEKRRQHGAIDLHGSCPTCGTPADDLGALMDSLLQEATEAEAEFARTIEQGKELAAEQARLQEAEKAAGRLPDLERSVRVTRDAAKSYQATLDSNRKALAEFDAGEQAAAADVSAAIEAPAMLQAQIDGARTAKAEAEQACRSFAKLQGVRQEKSLAEQERVKLEGHLEAVNGCVTRVKKLRDAKLGGAADRVRDPFELAVSTAFPGCEAWLEIVGDDGKPSVDFGIIRDGRQIGFDTLSGGERIAVLAALVGAIQVATAGGTRLVMLELGEADDERGPLVVKACDAIGFEQVILADCHSTDAGLFDGLVVNVAARRAMIGEAA